MNALRLFLATTVLACAAHAAAEVVYLPNFPSNGHDVQTDSNSAAESSDLSNAQ